MRRLRHRLFDLGLSSSLIGIPREVRQNQGMELASIHTAGPEPFRQAQVGEGFGQVLGRLSEETTETGRARSRMHRPAEKVAGRRDRAKVPRIRRHEDVTNSLPIRPQARSGKRAMHLASSAPSGPPFVPLSTPQSPAFSRFMRGDDTELTDGETRTRRPSIRENAFRPFTYPERDPADVRVNVFRAQPGGVRRGRLIIPGLVPELCPVIVVIGGIRPGPVILVTAGVHGAEVSSIQAARVLVRTLDPKTLRGTVILLPIMNPSAFRERRLYVTPLDGKNLNRVFPGHKRGTASERLAHTVTEEVLPVADVVIDLHGGDIVEALEPFVFVTERPPELSDRLAADPPGEVHPEPGEVQSPDRPAPEDIQRETLRLASRTGFPQVILGRLPGALVDTARFLGRPSFIAEAGGQGIVQPKAVSLLAASVRNVLQGCGALLEDPDPVDPGKVTLPFLRPSWTWVESPADGLWEPSITLGQEVHAEDPLGRIVDVVKDEVFTDLTAPCTGRVVFVVTALSTTVGTPLLAIAAPPVPWPGTGL